MLQAEQISNTASSTAFSFMDLPVELRNKIYEYVLADFNENYRKYQRKEIAPVLQQQQSLSSVKNVVIPSRPRKGPYAVTRYIQMKERLLALSHTNRQIRLKYRTTQNIQTHVYIPIALLRRYIEIFLYGSGPIEVQNHPAKVTVMFTDDFERFVDVLPFMEVLHRAPKMNYDVFTLRGHGIAQDQDIHYMIFRTLRDHMTTVRAEKAWRVLFGRHEAFTSLSIKLKREYEEVWMERMAQYGLGKTGLVSVARASLKATYGRRDVKMPLERGLSALGWIFP